MAIIKQINVGGTAYDVVPEKNIKQTIVECKESENENDIAGASVIKEMESNLDILYQSDFGIGGGCITYNPVTKKVSIDGIYGLANNGATLFSIPEEYRPKKNVSFYNICTQEGKASIYNLIIDTNGNVTANAILEDKQMNNLRLSANYIAK